MPHLNLYAYWNQSLGPAMKFWVNKIRPSTLPTPPRNVWYWDVTYKLYGKPGKTQYCCLSLLAPMESEEQVGAVGPDVGLSSHAAGSSDRTVGLGLRMWDTELVGGFCGHLWPETHPTCSCTWYPASQFSPIWVTLKKYPGMAIYWFHSSAHKVIGRHLPVSFWVISVKEY